MLKITFGSVLKSGAINKITINTKILENIP